MSNKKYKSHRVLLSRLETDEPCELHSHQNKVKWEVVSNAKVDHFTGAMNDILRNLANDYAEYKNCGVVYRMIRFMDLFQYFDDVSFVSPKLALSPKEFIPKKEREASQEEKPECQCWAYRNYELEALRRLSHCDCLSCFSSRMSRSLRAHAKTGNPFYFRREPEPKVVAGCFSKHFEAQRCPHERPVVEYTANASIKSIKYYRCDGTLDREVSP